MINHLRSITLKVEFSPGTDIREACCDMCQLATRVGCWVEGKFNGVTLIAREGDNPLGLMDSFHKELESGKTFKLARDNT